MQTTLLALLLLAASPGDAELRDHVKNRLSATVAETKTVTWYEESWSTNGKKEERTTANCKWMAPGRLRIDVVKGRVDGAAAIYRDGKVTGFKPGMFSFVKLSYDVRDKEVLGVRGQDMRSAGFLDDYDLILKQWDSASVAAGGSAVEVSYKNAAGLPTKMWLDPASFLPTKLESYEGEKAVERYVFKDIKLNTPVDTKLFEP